MSDVNFNITSNQASTSGGGGALAPTKITFNGTTDNTTSASFSDIAGMLDANFSLSSAQAIALFLTIDLYQAIAAASAEVEVQLLIDGVTPVVLGKHTFNYMDTADRQRATLVGVVNLAAGTHTVRPQWRRVQFGGTPTVDSLSYWNLLVVKS